MTLFCFRWITTSLLGSTRTWKFFLMISMSVWPRLISAFSPISSKSVASEMPGRLISFLPTSIAAILAFFRVCTTRIVSVGATPNRGRSFATWEPFSQSVLRFLTFLALFRRCLVLAWWRLVTLFPCFFRCRLSVLAWWRLVVDGVSLLFSHSY